MLKKFFVLSVALLLVGVSSIFAQYPGSILFGDEDSPDIIVSMSNPNWNNLRMSIYQHTTGIEVNWQAVGEDVSNFGMEALADWIDSNPQALAAGYVWITCCTNKFGGCRVRIPYSCDNCDCSLSGASNISETGVPFLGLFHGLQ